MRVRGGLLLLQAVALRARGRPQDFEHPRARTFVCLIRESVSLEAESRGFYCFLGAAMRLHAAAAAPTFVDGACVCVPLSPNEKFA